MGNKHGFTLMESLLTLLITSVITSLALNVISLVDQIEIFEEHKDIDIAIFQLMYELLPAHDIIVENNSISYSKNNNSASLGEFTSFVISFDGNRIVKQDGYMIYLENIQNFQVICYESKLHIYFVRDNVESKFLLSDNCGS